MRFGITLDINLGKNTPKKALEVAHKGFPGMVVVGGYSFEDSLSTSSTLLASSSSKKYAFLYVKKSASIKWMGSYNEKLVIATQKNDSKAKDKSLNDTDISSATRPLADQKYKPRIDCLNYFKVVDIINE